MRLLDDKHRRLSGREHLLHTHIVKRLIPLRQELLQLIDRFKGYGAQDKGGALAAEAPVRRDAPAA